MNKIFTVEGKWQKTDGGYSKRVLVHSTLFKPYIYEKPTVDGYIAYVPAPWNFKTDLSEGRLETLDERGVSALIESAQKEVEKKSEAIFGENGEGGTFGTHIGESPEVAAKPDLDGDVEDVFADQGSGELGRLMRQYIYWSMMEGQGWAASRMSPWSKPLWDSRDSWFQAPSLRSLTDIATTVVAAVATAPLGGIGAVAASAGINLADDALFTMMDVSGGYASWEDAGTAFGKKTLTTVATSAIHVGFGGTIAKAGRLNTFSGVLKQTALTGMKSYTTGVASSAIDAVSFDGGWSWDTDAFADGMEASNGGVLSGMASTITSGMMGLGIEGFTNRTYANATKLSHFVGGLAGQGVNYVLGEDAVFNLGKIKGAGLLELHLGEDGTSMNFGTSGMDASLGTIASSMAGLEAWQVNAELLFSNQKESRRYTSAMRTLYSAGATEREAYEEILAGRTNILENERGDFKAETTYDAGSRTKTITLGRDASADGSRFGLNVLFSHESYRNGIDDGETGQRIETDRAVEGHLKTATGLAQAYGLGSVGPQMLGEIIAYQAARNGYAQAYRDVLNGYDSSGDYWKVLRKGDKEFTLEWDGDTVIKDEYGNVIDDSDPRRVAGTDNESIASALYRLNNSQYAKDRFAQGMELTVDMRKSNVSAGYTSGWGTTDFFPILHDLPSARRTFGNTWYSSAIDEAMSVGASTYNLVFNTIGNYPSNLAGNAGEIYENTTGRDVKYDLNAVDFVLDSLGPQADLAGDALIASYGYLKTMSIVNALKLVDDIPDLIKLRNYDKLADVGNGAKQLPALYFPPNNGATGKVITEFLQKGTLIDRFGGTEYSKFFSPIGTSIGARSLPPGTASGALRTFEVMKPFPVEKSTIAPWFGEVGMGTQYMAPVRLEILLKREILREIK